ncbi:hypothetical protein LTR17_027238, partial [Elasticomyces elasticus]
DPDTSSRRIIRSTEWAVVPKALQGLERVFQEQYADDDADGEEVSSRISSQKVAEWVSLYRLA